MKTAEKTYRYKLIALNKLTCYPYSLFEIQDTKEDHIIEKSPWEIICDKQLLMNIMPEHYSMLCSAAIDDQLKYEVDLRQNIESFSKVIE